MRQVSKARAPISKDVVAENQRLRRQFWKNVLPAMLAFAFTGVYALVDGFFIGNKIGDVGLAAINVAYPITALIQAIGTGLGMGAAIEIAIYLGKGSEERAQHCFGNAIALLGIFSVVVTVVLYFSFVPLLRVFGAEGETLTRAAQYLKVIVLGAVFQVVSTGLVPILRNYGGALIAMFAMIAGFVANIVLDYVFIFVCNFGMAGAAAATIIGQAITIVPAVWYLAAKKKLPPLGTLKLNGGIVKAILTVGASPFGLSLSPNIVLLLMNKAAFVYGGDNAVAAYAIISYTSCVVQLLMQGIGDGSQPLVSRSFGKGNLRAAQRIRNMALCFALVVAAVGMGLTYLLRGVLPVFFGASDVAAAIVVRAFPIYLTSFLCYALLRIMTSYFYAVKRNILAYVLVYGEPLVLLVILFSFLPRLLGLDGVWWSVPLAELVLSAVAVVLLVAVSRRERLLLSVIERERQRELTTKSIQADSAPYQDDGIDAVRKLEQTLNADQVDTVSQERADGESDC